MTLVDYILDAFKEMGATEEEIRSEEVKLMTDDEYFLDCVETYCTKGLRNATIH
jgi:hypothetical protein